MVLYLNDHLLCKNGIKQRRKMVVINIEAFYLKVKKKLYFLARVRIGKNLSI